MNYYVTKLQQCYGRSMLFFVVVKMRLGHQRYGIMMRVSLSGTHHFQNMYNFNFCKLSNKTGF